MTKITRSSTTSWERAVRNLLQSRRRFERLRRLRRCQLELLRAPMGLSRPLLIWVQVNFNGFRFVFVFGYSYSLLLSWVLRISFCLLFGGLFELVWCVWWVVHVLIVNCFLRGVYIFFYLLLKILFSVLMVWFSHLFLSPIVLFLLFFINGIMKWDFLFSFWCSFMWLGYLGIGKKGPRWLFPKNKSLLVKMLSFALGSVGYPN